ncbi:MAG: triose-phosphate isomerase [Bacillota bacterium]
MSEEGKQKIIEFLKNFTGSEKGVATAAEIQKGAGLSRQEAGKLIKELEADGVLVGAGRSAGVWGYKLKG